VLSSIGNESRPFWRTGSQFVGVADRDSATVRFFSAAI
jgi:hypothetical protein